MSIARFTDNQSADLLCGIARDRGSGEEERRAAECAGPHKANINFIILKYRRRDGCVPESPAGALCRPAN